jgi:hypothetical protein
MKTVELDLRKPVTLLPKKATQARPTINNIYRSESACLIIRKQESQLSQIFNSSQLSCRSKNTPIVDQIPESLSQTSVGLANLKDKRYHHKIINLINSGKKSTSFEKLEQL